MKGAWAEAAARRHLERLGYRFVAQNRRTPFGEIDLWMEHHGVPVFVEVKQRKDTRFGTPAEAITAGKIERLRKSALYLLGRDDVPVRFLAALVEGDSRYHRIRLVEIEP